jgi:hypothetical protein
MRSVWWSQERGEGFSDMWPNETAAPPPADLYSRDFIPVQLHFLRSTGFPGGGRWAATLGIRRHCITLSTQTQTENRSVAPERSSSGETVVGFAVLGCLVADGVGIAKALSMESGVDVLLCLLGSVAAFGMVFYVYFRKA